MATTIRFNNKTDFTTTLRKRVNSYFKENNLERTGNTFVAFKTIFFITITFGPLALLLFGNLTFWQSVPTWMLLGFGSAMCGLNICHDAIHGDLFKNKLANKLCYYLFNMVGANAYLWTIMHNKCHHTYTNINGHDEDLDVVPIIRLSPKQKHLKMQKYQHFYAFGLYALASLSWVFIKDYKKFFQKSIGPFKREDHPPIEYFNLFFFKAVYYTLFLILPLVMMDLAWYQVLLGFFLGHVVEGYTLALVFMLAHEVEHLDFPEPNEEGKVDNEWYEHQLYTTANFATQKPLANFLCGGLNFQIEHHLFPNICHIHYPAISKIVKQTAAEYNIPYIENDSFVGAIASHYRLLKKLGADDLSDFNKKKNKTSQQPQVAVA